jgi:hypothetical protein
MKVGHLQGMSSGYALYSYREALFSVEEDDCSATEMVSSMAVAIAVLWQLMSSNFET